MKCFACEFGDCQQVLAHKIFRVGVCASSRKSENRSKSVQ